MANGRIFGKHADRNFSSNPNCNRKRKNPYENSQKKENIYDFINFHTNKKGVGQKDCNRLEGGCGQQEIFYDCKSWDLEQDEIGILQQQLQIFEVINEIRNPKEFRGLLRQMAYTSSVLYRTFRQAYSKTKKCKQKKVKEFGMTSAMNPWDIINIEAPTSNHEYLENVRHENAAMGKQANQKYPDHSTRRCLKKQKCFCYMCTTSPKLKDKGEPRICPICLGFIENETNICCEKCNQEPLTTEKTEYFEYENENIENKTIPGLSDENICQNFGEELQHLGFCERCAVLRGETAFPNKVNGEQQVIEDLPETFNDVNNIEAVPSSKTAKTSNQTQTAGKQVLNLSPVCVSIPLKLQIDGQNCQKRCLETEIQMKAFAASESKLLTCIKNLRKVQKPTFPTEHHTDTTPDIVSKSAKSDKLEEKSDSGTFHSCISNSGIIRAPETPNTCNDMALNEILDMMKKHMPSFKEPSVQREMQSKGIQMSPPEIPKTSVPKAPPSRTNFTQTVEAIQPTAMLPTAAPLSQLDPEIKGSKLRAELLEEIRAALDKTTTKEALKALQEGKRFSLPPNLVNREIPNVRPARHSAPSNYLAIPTRTGSLRPFTALPITTMTGFKTEISRKPELPPKPAIAPKPTVFATGAVQTDSSTIRPSGHVKRTEIRNQIQEELKELLEKNPSTSKAKYRPEEKDELLLELYKLFHPEKAGKLPKQVSLENALQDIHYILETEEQKPETVNSSGAKTSESKESILQNIKYILNPKLPQKPTKRRKYSKDIKSKILEDLHILLTPRSNTMPERREIRTSVLEDLRFILNTDQNTTTTPRSQALQHSMAADIGPGPSGAQQMRQARQQKPPNEIRDSVMNDLKFFLDFSHPNQAGNNLATNLAATRQAAKYEIATAKISVSSDESLSDHEKHK